MRLSKMSPKGFRVGEDKSLLLLINFDFLSGVVLKPVNRYKHRPLPHLIGSAEFRTDQTLGLREAPSDEETDDFLSASDKVNTSALTMILY